MTPSSVSTSHRITQGILLFGSSGQLGTALTSAIRAAAAPYLVTLSWPGLQHQMGSDENLRKILREAINIEKYPYLGFDVIFANGITDPSVSEVDIIKSNVEFPKRVIRLLSTLPNSTTRFRYMTFGTIHENFPQLCATNPYFRSKLRLSEWMKEQASTSVGKGHYLHMRFHTLYGGKPSPHLFLGQMIRSIQNNTPFRMSTGTQLREYHHVEDIASIVVSFLTKKWTNYSLIEVNSGQAVRLVDLAEAIFDALEVPELLRVGALEPPRAENQERVFARSQEWILSASRDPIAGVIESVRQIINRPTLKPPT